MIGWVRRILRGRAKKSLPGPGHNDPAAEPQVSCGFESFQSLFTDDETLITRDFLCGKRRCHIAYIDGMVDAEIINRNIIEPMVRSDPPEGGDIYKRLLDTVITVDGVKRHDADGAAAEAAIAGDTVLFIDGAIGALSFSTKKWTVRAITEPETEKATKGPREGFNESLITNLTLIRRKISTPDLKIKFGRIGRRSNTRMCVVYLKGLANPAVLDELYRRLDAIDIDSVLSINYIDELIRDSPASMFLTCGSTERPDVVAAKLLEGRVALLVEGCPCGLTVPFIFVEYFQAAEDYYGNYWLASIGRIMRIIGFALTVTIPAFYLAIVTMHQEMVPTDLLIAINASRQQVPLPGVLELILMIIVIEIMRESGARVPSFLGQSLSIVGGLVIGQAAVTARLISAPIIIVISLSAITSLLIPKIEGAAFMFRIGFILITSVLGLYGLMIGMTAMIIHLLGIRSFGVHYLSNVLPTSPQDFKDTAVRMPWYHMNLRPRHISAADRVRQPRRKP